MIMDARDLLFLGSSDIQVLHPQPITGTPIEDPLPKIIISIALISTLNLTSKNMTYNITLE